MVRLWVTGADDQLDAFHQAVSMRLQSAQRREGIVTYLCFEGDLEDVIALAREASVRVEILPWHSPVRS